MSNRRLSLESASEALRALNRTGGNKEEAARLLGISCTTIKHRIEDSQQ